MTVIPMCCTNAQNYQIIKLTLKVKTHTQFEVSSQDVSPTVPGLFQLRLAVALLDSKLSSLASMGTLAPLLNSSSGGCCQGHLPQIQSPGSSHDYVILGPDFSLLVSVEIRPILEVLGVRSGHPLEAHSSFPAQSHQVNTEVNI